MQIKSAILFATIAFTPLGVIAVGCFTGGQKGDCGDVINDFCQTVTQNLVAGETRHKCYNKGGIKCDMSIRNNNGGTSSANIDNCVSVNEATNLGCHSQGGIANSEGFSFTLDPNAGTC